MAHPTSHFIDHSNNGRDNGPMQPIVRLLSVDGRDVELLACGHLRHVADRYGGRHSRCQRRRCSKCKEGAPADIAAADFFRQPGDSRGADSFE